MADPESTHTRLAHGYRRRIAPSGDSDSTI
jgi:hypothetical protein